MMEGTYYKEWSTALGRDMEFKVYGTGGVPVLAFPCQGGRFYDWENNGMPDAAAWLIQNGRIQLFCADSIDQDSFLAEGLSPRRRAEMQEKYFCYVTGELAPRILALNAAAKAADKPAKAEKTGPILWAVGADLGAYQAVNCRLRRPELFCGAIGLSGRYDVSGWLGGPEVSYDAAAVLVFQSIDLSAFEYDAQGVDTIFPALIAGAIGGFVYGLCLRRNASTGGADVVAKYVSKRDPLLNFFWVNFAINAAIAAVSYFVYAVPDAAGKLTYDYKPVCLCMLYCLMSSMVGNAILRGAKSALKFMIITSHAAEIEEEIVARLKHGATRLAAVGAYSNAPRDVIVCVVNKRQIVEFKEILQKYDNTFTFVEPVNETIGNFKHVK